MAKRKRQERRRLDRRRQHQEAQSQLRRERRQAVRAAAEEVAGALARLGEAALDSSVAPAAFVEQVVEELGDDVCARMLTHPEIAEAWGVGLAEEAGEERALALAGALGERLAELPRLGFLAAGLAQDSERPAEALALAERALGVLPEEDEAAPKLAALAGSLAIAAGRAGSALELLGQWCAREPEDAELQLLRARALAPAAVDGLEGEEAAAAAAWREQMGDRTALYRLRAALERFVAGDPELAAWQAGFVAELLEDARESAGLSPLEELGGEGALRLRVVQGEATALEEGPGDASTVARLEALGVERAWLSGPDPAGEPSEEEPEDEATVLGRFAAAAATPPELAALAREWLGHVRYGLWLLADPPPAEATPFACCCWVTDLVTRRTVHAALAPEQVGGLPRWSVLAGALAPVKGVWRSGVTMLALDPGLADRATEAVLESSALVLAALAREHGIKAPRPHRHRGGPRPHGVLAELAEPMEEHEADLAGKVLGSFLGRLVGMVEATHRQGPRLTNTDGEPLELLRAKVATEDPAGVRRRLLASGGFEGEEEELGEGAVAPPLRWLGREMSAAEAATSVAQFRAEAARRGWGPVEEPEGPRHWLRGTISFEQGAVRVEVNSRQRLEAACQALRRAGASAAPEVEVGLDPGLDLPLGGRPRLGRGQSPEAEAAWREHWLDEKVPALEGATPRAAAADPRRRPLLEALLRQFEHEADQAAADGDRPLEVAWLRAQLGMQDGLLEPHEGPSRGA